MGTGGRFGRHLSRYPERIMSTATLGCLGATLSMSLPWPQVWRSCALGRIIGLSPSATFLGVAMPAGWITYGLLIGDRLQILANTVTGVAGLAVLIALLVARADLRSGRGLAISAAAAATVGGAAGFSGLAAALPQISGGRMAPLLGAVLAVAATLSAVPQPLALLRDRAQDLTGLSVLRWRLGVAACACWSLYGLRTGHAAVCASALAGLAGAAVVCAVVAARRPDPAANATPGWRDAVTTPTIVMAGV
jgi:uncharacterized protein with PQ loop repeat